MRKILTGAKLFLMSIYIFIHLEDEIFCKSNFKIVDILGVVILGIDILAIRRTCKLNVRMLNIKL